MILPSTWSLPEAVRSRLGRTTYGRQRAIFEEGHLLLVLHKPPGPDEQKREGVLFWRTPAGEWQQNRGGPGTGGLKRHVQEYAELEERLAKDYEEARDVSRLFELIDALTPLARSAHNMHAALQSAREAAGNDPLLIELRDLAYETERNFALLLEDARNALQFRTARQAEEQAALGRSALAASHRLNILAALFLPLTAITSLFGMNFEAGLDRRLPWPFWVVLAAGIVLGVFIKGWILAGTGKKPEDGKPGSD
jgi:hypothetical protein